MKNWREGKINTIEKSDFPKQLKEIQNAQKVFYRGNWIIMFLKNLSIVGSRKNEPIWPGSNYQNYACFCG